MFFIVIMLHDAEKEGRASPKKVTLKSVTILYYGSFNLPLMFITTCQAKGNYPFPFRQCFLENPCLPSEMGRKLCN